MPACLIAVLNPIRAVLWCRLPNLANQSPIFRLEGIFHRLLVCSGLVSPAPCTRIQANRHLIIVNDVNSPRLHCNQQACAQGKTSTTAVCWPACVWHCSLGLPAHTASTGTMSAAHLHSCSFYCRFYGVAGSRLLPAVALLPCNVAARVPVRGPPCASTVHFRQPARR